MQQDIYSLFHLDRPFKFISKTSNFFIPIIGWSMFLTGALCQALRADATLRLASIVCPLCGQGRDCNLPRKVVGTALLDVKSAVRCV